MGAVYEAEHVLTRRHVAIKVMNPDGKSDAEAVKRFMNEASAAGKIQHPNVVEVLDAGQDPEDGALFIVLELLTGIDLANYLLRYSRLAPSEVLTIVCQVLQALVVAHRAGVVHRDIKPENIFLARQVSGETHVKIVDFGISKAINPESNVPLSITQSNTTVGTPHYMSPEQCKGEGIDTRADIWALGVVMYECLTGHLPFDGENFNTQIVAVVTEPHLPVARYGVDPELSDLVDRCLQKDRNRRYASAADMLDAIRRYIDRHPEHGVRPALLKEPTRLEPVVAPARPNDPTTPINLDPAALAMLAEGPSDTIEQLPVFPGMVPLEDDGHADNLPTTVRAVVPGGIAPVPIALRPVRTSVTPPPPDAWGPDEDSRVSNSPRNYLVVGLLLVAAAALGGTFAVWSLRRTPPPTAQAVLASRMATLHFLGMPEGARAVVGDITFYSDTAIVPRANLNTRVRVEASGYVPFEFSIVPDRDQEIRLTGLQPVPLAVPPAPPPTPPPTPVVNVVPPAPALPAPGPRAAGMLSVAALPRCRVLVDGQDYGFTPIVHRRLAAGPHRVACERTGARQAVRTVVVQPNREEQAFFDVQ